MHNTFGRGIPRPKVLCMPVELQHLVAALEENIGSVVLGKRDVVRLCIVALLAEFKDADVRFVSVTVDPSTDTPERLQTYADQFGADPNRWWFLTGPLGETQELGRSLHVTVIGTTHTDQMILLDRRQII